MSLLASLNPQQLEAVQCTEGPLLLLAGAGSGKTRAVTVRVAHLILDKGVSPDAILAVTFTNKAANEMRERIGDLLRAEGWTTSRLPMVSTFHAFCVRLLRQYGAPLREVRKGFATNFTIVDDADQMSLIKAALRVTCPNAGIKSRSVLSAISLYKNGGRIGLMPKMEGVDPEILDELYRAYEKALIEANALDFDDLLLEAVRLLTDYEDVLAKVRARFKYLMVDEYQDTNRAQYELVLLLAGAHRNVCVVGDEDQSIYSWRGADIGNILGFERDFPEARVMRLEQNYRSTGYILAAASAVVKHNKARKGKRLWTQAPDGERPIVYELADGHEEARCVVQQVQRLLGDDPEAKVGILYRTNAQSRLIEEALRRESIDFVVVGGVTFYQRAEVKDMLAYLRVAFAPRDTVSLRRILNVPARGIGASTVQRLTELAAKEDSSLWEALVAASDQGLLAARTRAALSRFRALMDQIRQLLETQTYPEVLEQIPEITGYRRMLEDQLADGVARLENLQELGVAADEAYERDESLEEFLDHAALVSDSDNLQMTARVLLLTLHNAKGLEFPAVIITGMEERLLPHQRSIGFLEQDKKALEEERRLCYVGMTRAKRHLILTCARYRRLFVSSPAILMDPSRFLQEIPEHLINRPAARATGFGSFRAGVARQSAPATPQPSNPNSGSGPSSPIQTHDSVAAIAGFFADRGIKADVPAGNGPDAAKAAGSSPAAAALPPSPPKLGQALTTLRNQGEFPKGTRVRHKKFGDGVVQRREGEGAQAKLSVYFRNYGMKKLVAGYANLQVV